MIQNTMVPPGPPWPDLVYCRGSCLISLNKERGGYLSRLPPSNKQQALCIEISEKVWEERFILDAFHPLLSTSLSNRSSAEKENNYRCEYSSWVQSHYILHCYLLWLQVYLSQPVPLLCGRLTHVTITVQYNFFMWDWLCGVSCIMKLIRSFAPLKTLFAD